MGQIKSSEFWFDNTWSGIYSLEIVSVENTDNKSKFGTNRSIINEEGVGDTPIFLSVRDSCPEIEIEIAKINQNGKVVPFEYGELDDISKWLLKKTPKALECDERIYYGIFGDGERWDNGYETGYLKLTFMLVTPYIYTSKKYNKINVFGSNKISIDNTSTYDTYIYPDVEFKLDNATDITILNETNGIEMKFINLEPFSHIICYNDGLKQIVDVDNKNTNVVGKFNKKWLKLEPGINKIKISTIGSVTITSQFKMNLI